MIALLSCAAVFAYILFYVVILSFIDCDVQLAFYEKFGKSIDHLRGKVVFITGASTGIGKHTALALAKHGVKLVLTARRYALLEEVKEQCLDVSQGALTKHDVLILQMDMLDIASHENHFQAALSHFGQIDILLNNAGRSQRALWERIDIDIDRKMFELNVFSVLNLTRVAMTYFNSKGQGHVAATSSMAGIISLPFSASYTGSKHALQGYYNSLRLEKLNSKLDLTVTVICPGPTYSGSFNECFTDTPAKKCELIMKETDNRMTGERCGYLCAVALANKSREAWISIFPQLYLYYAFVYFPHITYLAVKSIGPEKFFRFRDSGDMRVFLEEESK